MQIHSAIADLRAALKNRGRIVFVPTMGNLHAGHISLMEQARAHGDTVVASIFVNRLQFGPNEDFDKYPRTFQADCDKLAAAGVDVLFAPTEADLYPEPQEYLVEPPGIQNVLDGEFRPGHFRGVATVVTKLFNMRPARCSRLRQEGLPAADGHPQHDPPAGPADRPSSAAKPCAPTTAWRSSSRNGYLSEAERAEAPRLYRLLNEIRDGHTRRRGGYDQTGKISHRSSSTPQAGKPIMLQCDNSPTWPCRKA